jgi:hypothetical protein
MDQDVDQAIADLVGGGADWTETHARDDETGTVTARFQGREDDPRTLTAFARIIGIVRWTVAQSLLVRVWQDAPDPPWVLRDRLGALRRAFGDTLPIELQYALDDEKAITKRAVAQRRTELRQLSGEAGDGSFATVTQLSDPDELHSESEDEDENDIGEDDEE